MGGHTRSSGEILSRHSVNPVHQPFIVVPSPAAGVPFAASQLISLLIIPKMGQSTSRGWSLLVEECMFGNGSLGGAGDVVDELVEAEADAAAADADVVGVVDVELTGDELILDLPLYLIYLRLVWLGTFA